MNRKSLLIAALAFGTAAAAIALIIADSKPATPELPAGAGDQTNVSMLKQDGGLETVGEDDAYFDGTKGYYARPRQEGSYPGVVMIHEWWGLNDQIRQMAEQLAAEGYQVLAVDLYEGKVAATPEEARGLAQSLDKAKAVANMRTAADFLRSKGAAKIASFGWCFGGGQSLQLALSGESLDATVIYYGDLETDEKKLSVIHWPVLGIFGGKDQSIKPETVAEFDGTLDKLGVENEIHIYPNVGHAFANPSGANYAPEETRDAWKKTLDFLKRSL